jgi:hypothetical protein
MTYRLFIAALILAPLTAAPVQAAPAPVKAGAKVANFPAFFRDFRAAVLANDRQKVADMTRFPFHDYQEGDGNRTANSRAEFLAKYDLILTRGAIEAIRQSMIRGHEIQSDDGEAPGPIQKGEYLLQAPVLDDQLVFAPAGGTYRLVRIAFFS